MAFVDLRIDADDVLGSLNESEIVEYYGGEALLQEIGVEEAKAYFGLKEDE